MKIKMRLLALGLGILVATLQNGRGQLPSVTNHFEPNWNSLTNYQFPEWFRDAKFGIWANFGPQCQPEHGDWYARLMYQEGSADYQSHLAEYGHPSTNGFKDIIHLWKAEHFDPDRLLKFYKDNGAKYFMALAAHCDNFDLFNSKYQSWNSVAIGPHKDVIGMWAAAARKNGLRFGVSLHNGGWTWRWYEPAQGADTNGPLAGVPYDGKLTKADGKGLWWDGLDPQDLYCQNHAIGAPPTAAYCENFRRRTLQLWDDYHPDLIYFDEFAVPLRYLGVGDDLGLSLYAHFYNSSIAWHGTNEAVITAKGLAPEQRKALVYDIERGKADGILPEPWQTDTCIGYWHYDRSVFEHHGYKTAAMIIPMLADIVSKNGNLMLSVPVCPDGTIDTDEQAIVSEIGAWLKVNGEAIYATRPWKIYGEGPATMRQEKGEFGGQKDVSSEPFTSDDIRFTQSKDEKCIYAIVLGIPNSTLKIKSLAGQKISHVTLLGSDEKIDWRMDADALVIQPVKHWPTEYAVSFKLN